MDASEKKVNTGTLFIVATPIGNMEDITLRALNVLDQADCIAAEDTRHTRRLLDRLNIKNRLVSCHEHNEREKTAELVKHMASGRTIALVSDAGTPSVSDPGYFLVKAAINSNIPVVPIPGVSAVITALSVSGLPTDAFVFMGFPPKKAGKRKTLLKELFNEKKTMVFYESPRRVVSFLEDLENVLGDRSVVVAREMTKIHEEFIRGRISDVINTLRQKPDIKGEIVILVSGAEKKDPINQDALKHLIRQHLEEKSLKLSEISKILSKEHGFSRSSVYNLILEVKKEETGCVS